LTDFLAGEAAPIGVQDFEDPVLLGCDSTVLKESSEISVQSFVRAHEVPICFTLGAGIRRITHEK